MQSMLWVYVAVVLAAYFVYTNKESFGEDDDQGNKKLCRMKAKKSLWSKYDWSDRIETEDGWKCPSGWEGTGCTWGMGKEFERKQCRRLKTPAGSAIRIATDNALCNAGVRVFSEYGFKSTDKYPTQTIPCGGEVQLPTADGKMGYSSIIVPAGLTATVKFTILPKYTGWARSAELPKTETKTYVGPIETNFEGQYNDAATSVSVALS